MPSVYEIADDKMDKIEIIMSKYFSFVRTGDPELREAARARIQTRKLMKLSGNINTYCPRFMKINKSLRFTKP